MRVLLTGASGFLGSYVLNSLHQQGIDTVVLGRKPPNHNNNFNYVDTAFIEADLLAPCISFTSLAQKAKATHLLHLAWYAEHGKYWASPLNLRWVEATTHLTEAFCQAGGQRVVVAGTCAEYDWSYGYCREDNTPLNPATLYGVAKDASRRLVMAVCSQHQVPCAWGRVFLPFGVGESKERLIPSLIDVFQDQRPPFGVNAAAYRDFLYASDVADALITLLKNNLCSGAYNISSGEPVQLEALVYHLADLLGANPHVVLDLTTERPTEPTLLVGENQKIRTLGWQPKLSLVQGLKALL